MPRASKKQLSKTIYEELDDHFSYLISSLQSPNDIDIFFNDFLSAEEKTMLTKRLMLHLMLESGYQTPAIKAVLGMSFETIRVHRNIWGKGGKTYKAMLQKLVKREKAKLFWKKVESILKPLNLALHAESDMKARAKLLNRNYD